MKNHVLMCGVLGSFCLQLFTAAVADASHAKEAAVQEAVRQVEFPSLSSTAPSTGAASKAAAPTAQAAAPTTPLPTANTGRILTAAASAPARPSGGEEFSFQAAFSEDEQEEGEGEEGDGEEDEPAPAGAEQAQQATGGEQAQAGGTSSNTQDITGTSLKSQASESLAGSIPKGAGVGAGTTAAANVTPNEYYVYQSIDGQWTFLDPLNVRCLLAHHGSYEACPATVTASVIELEDVVQVRLGLVCGNWCFQALCIQ